MTPYTMKINIQNGLAGEVAYLGATCLKGDGCVCGSGKGIAAGSTDEGVSLKKGGGTEGLFMATFFSIPGCPKNLLVQSSMSAASDSKVIVRIAFVDADKSVTSLPDDCYYRSDTMDLTDTEAKTAAIDDNNAFFTAKLEKYDGKYPDSTCTVSVKCWRAIKAKPERVY
ncbi:hypothetical protein DL766_009417 [Monosporascus sp. MC13-8B]|uniref:Uncharacterized protein n=1 Tax=Monosporascus cannonballus TaxID=155416 RepID=A0ABY0H5J7_9PEZI|nr:hypothetical protein DL762_005393 [Monosporascus cannonballus]RYP00644.1 hypothetical protein DL763_000698 [Monosporascus cannonballus]RYP15420.1 hypothetical protein DL766_009417 [Monosporascus sp. MC13-8B]